MKKKIVAIFIATILSVSLVACGGNSTADTKQETKTSVAATDKKDDKKDDTGKEDSKKKETEKAEAEKESEDKKSETADKTDATEKADKKDSKETSNKAEKPNDNKVADKSDKDKGSANNSNSSVSKPSTPDKPNKPSGNNSGSSNNGNHNGSVNKPSKPVEKPVEKPSEPSKPVEKPVEKPSEPQKPAPHVCNFNIWKDEVSHTEMVTETYTEQVPKYKWVSYDECRKCGFQSSDPDVMDAHCLDCDSTYTTLEKQVQDGFETVTKTRQVPKTVVDDPAHYECSCGKRK